jgi:hypothetical protein
MKLKAFLAEYPTVIYLNDSGVEIDGLKFGVHQYNHIYNWAFNRIGDDICYWEPIP